MPRRRVRRAKPPRTADLIAQLLEVQGRPLRSVVNLCPGVIEGSEWARFDSLTSAIAY